MTRTWVLSLAALVVASCGGETTEPLSAAFPMGPREVRRALVERFAGTLMPDDAFWPESQPALDVDVSVVRDALVDFEERAETFAGRSFKVAPATVTADSDASPVDAVELWIGPADATGVDDERSTLLAHGAVPRTKGASSELVWTQEGPRLLSQALNGRVGPETEATRFVLFLRGRATLHLEPGAPLPVGTAEAKVLVDVPLRYSP